MDLKDFKFPKVTGVDMAFSTLRTIPELLAEAKNRGFYDGNTPYNDLFSNLFHRGGRIVWKKDVDENLKANAWPYMKAYMRSFEPKHEDKEAICALIMSELLEPHLDKATK